MRNFVSSSIFKTMPTTPGTGVRKDFLNIPQSSGERSIDFTISSSTIDRSGDVIDQSGWILDDYLKSPVVLYGHDHQQLPIGRCTAIGIEGGALKATVEFVPQDMPVIGEKAEAVFRMLKSGFLSATSVGFLPLEYSMSKEADRHFGMDFAKQVLLEFSVCAVGDNPEALIEPNQRDQSGDANKPAVIEAQHINNGRLARERRLRSRELISRAI